MDLIRIIHSEDQIVLTPQTKIKKIMKTTTKTLIATAAIAGILGASPAFAAAAGTTANAGAKVTTMEDKGKNSCKGKNGCKGEGGCKSGDNGCKGKNSCKGKGGCATDGSKQ